MSLKEPSSMEELVYFTRRKIEEHGAAVVWAYRQDCPKCKKAKMGKPVDPKTKKVKSRSKEYVCPACNHTVQKEEYEATLTVEAKVTCPHCKKQGECTGPFAKKPVKIFDVESQKKKAAKAIKLKCEHCQGDILITQKMK